MSQRQASLGATVELPVFRMSCGFWSMSCGFR